MPSEYEHQIARYRHKFLEKKYEGFGLQKPDGYYLVMIAKAGLLKMSRMIQEAPFHKSHATRTINRLVDQGLVVKTLDAEDLRGYVLGVTEKGREIAEAVEAIHKEWQELLYKPLSKEELQTIETIRIKISEFMKKHFEEEE